MPEVLRGSLILEAASGFEPLNGSFADCSLNHLGTPPCIFERRVFALDRHSTVIASVLFGKS